jgi:guanylate kinase
VIAGPSGVGKGTVVRRVLELVPGLFLSVSATTRAPRPSERDGVDYHFVSESEFDRMIVGGELLEWADIFGHRSGTPAGPVREVIDAGGMVLLELDVEGARQVRAAAPDAVLILLEPPSLGELERRLRSRGTEDEADLRIRLAKAEWELGQRPWFDHEVTNDELERAAAEVAAIIDGPRTASGGAVPDGRSRKDPHP